jgi:two-component system, OmpR family, alkaline phosphatase synthesis response regulator PhoP
MAGSEPISVLVIADRPEKTREFQDALAAEGIAVTGVKGAAEGWKLLEKAPPSLVILDFDVPDDKCLSLCARIRAHPAAGGTPILVVVDKTRPGEKEKAFAAKADACLGRPFQPQELKLWVRALLRRAQVSEKAGGVLRAEDFTVDPQSRTVTVGDRVIRDLTKKEFDLLYELVRCRPRVLSKQFIMGSLWRSVLRDNTVEVHVRNLRAKLGDAASRIVTVPKAGYRFQ